MTKKQPESGLSAVKKVAQKSTGKTAASKVASASGEIGQRHKASIFDESFSPIGSERKKAWSRHDRKRV